jgi:ABC-type glycerol-3-phosphate transport system substrate-binding protein
VKCSQRPALCRRTLLGTATASAAGASALLALATGCGQGPASPPGAAESGGAVARLEGAQEIVFWHTQSQENGRALEALVQRFNQTNGQQITVRPEFQNGYTQLHQKNLATLSAGTPTDVSVAYESFVAEYQRGNACVDLEPYVKDRTAGLSKESLEDIFPAYLAGLRFPQYGNQLLSFPFTKSLLVMYANDDVLQRAGVRQATPRTWTEFADAVRGASRQDATLLVEKDLGALADPNRARTYGWATWPDASTINGWAFSRGGDALSADGKAVRFTEAPFLEAFQLAEDAFRRGYAYNPPRQPGSDYDFAANRFAFMHSSSTSRPFLRKVMRDNGREALPWRVLGLPQKDPARPANVLYGANVALFRTTPQRQAAGWAFIKWFTDREQDVEWSITSYYMPIRRSSAETPRLKAFWDQEDPQGRQAFELSRTARPEPTVRGWQEIRPVIQKALQDVIEGKETSKNALDNAQREATQILQAAG